MIETVIVSLSFAAIFGWFGLMAMIVRRLVSGADEPIAPDVRRVRKSGCGPCKECRALSKVANKDGDWRGDWPDRNL